MFSGVDGPVDEVCYGAVLSFRHFVAGSGVDGFQVRDEKTRENSKDRSEENEACEYSHD